jgi:UDP-2,3-diacylglucosamine hydrolase
LKIDINLLLNKKIYFASDFHLGAVSPENSRMREQLICAWLDSIKPTCQVLFLVGDVFDFWYEYRHAVPKGFVRLLGKLAEMTDEGIQIHFFAGNHDMWVWDYFQKELGIQVHRREARVEVVAYNQTTTFYVVHGDGYGPADYGYKYFLKNVFENPFFRWAFRWVHPDVGLWLGNSWAKRSRIKNDLKNAERFLGEDKEWLFTHAKEVEKTQHHNYYVFGHRHVPLDLTVNQDSRYINLGEWVHNNTYAVFDENGCKLQQWDNN